jgi:hydroxyacylglutathione hydrolase
LLMSLRVSPIPAFTDNYIWLIESPDGARGVVVDPGEAGPVIERFAGRGMQLGSILVTHHHGDHVGGIRRLLAQWPDCPVYGPAGERIPGITQPVVEGDRVGLPAVGCTLGVMRVPGHTAGHIAYYGEGALFCGDTLFAAGCGRVFDGTMEELHASLERIKKLPPETLVYCAHEYTLDNLGFARWVEPDSGAVDAREARARVLREHGQPTVPSTLAEELASNPFLRVHEPVVRAAAERFAGRPLGTDSEVFAAIRSWKDREYD